MAQPYHDPYAAPENAGATPASQPSASLPHPLSPPAGTVTAPVYSSAVRAAAPPHSSPGVPAIAVENVSRSFGPVQALANLSFTAAAGRVTALVGPNGCGKSTLMLMLAALLAPDEGKVRVFGVDPSDDAESVCRMVGWMPDALGAWDSLTVREVIETIGRAYFMDQAAVRQRSAHLLAELDLETLADAPARVLSRGQKQRLGLARTLIHSPQLLVLDEPASGLDPGSRRRLFHIVRSHAEQGGSVLLSSHILGELEEMADDVVFMDSGRLVHQMRLDDAGALEQRWQIRTLDFAALATALTDLEHPFTVPPENKPRADGRGVVHVNVDNEQEAARLGIELGTRGVPIVSFGPLAGRLESAYMSLEAAHRKGAL